jgi:stage V sporulation protein G
MEISEIRVKLIPNPSDRLKAFCSITFDSDFVIRDIKIIDGTSGIFVAMPSRKLADRCSCGAKNHLRARYCNECGTKLPQDRAPRGENGRSKLHADIAHPINSTCRQRVQEGIIEAYKIEVERSEEPGYQPVDIDLDEHIDQDEHIAIEPPQEQPQEQPQDQQEPEDEEEEYGSDDYAALIEDLKGSAARRRSEREDAPRAAAPVEDTPPRRREPTPAPRAKESRPAPPAREPAPAPRAVEPAPAPRAAEPASNDDSDDFGAGIL